jgi:predicted lipoprotein with Yx(FWY)xxD motif
MKYGSTASVAGTSNSNAQQQQQQYEQSVISAASGQTMFTMDGGQSQSSVSACL